MTWHKTHLSVYNQDKLIQQSESKSVFFTTKTSMPSLFGFNSNSCQLQQKTVLSGFGKNRPVWPNIDNGHYFLINNNSSHHSHIYFVINSNGWVLPIMKLSQSTFWCTIFIINKNMSHQYRKKPCMPMLKSIRIYPHAFSFKKQKIMQCTSCRFSVSYWQQYNSVSKIKKKSAQCKRCNIEIQYSKTQAFNHS